MSLIQKVIIVGGGTAGWMAAALLARLMGHCLDIEVVESEEVPTIGVGEATVPAIVSFHNVLKINEQEFLRATQGTIKLGIEFEHWSQGNDCYMHAFGNIGKEIGITNFINYWLRAKKLGQAGDYWQYSLNYQAAKANKFSNSPNVSKALASNLPYAYHFDASLYAQFLANYCRDLGVRHTTATVNTVNLNKDTGNISTLGLNNGQTLAGDFYIDCSGFKGLLIEQALHTGYEDWSDYLRCNRAIALPCQTEVPIRPYTRSIAHKAGWSWEIPLQHRIGNGIVYSSDYISDDEASAILREQVRGAPLADPKLIRFCSGRRKQQWNKNCVALGLAAGFVEPLESTALYLIQSGIVRLLKLFPMDSINSCDINEYNLQSQKEFESIRDFIVLHYYLNHKTDAPFWLECQQQKIPDSLNHKIELFRSGARFFRAQHDFFSEVAWQQVMLGQGLIPKNYHPQVDAISEEHLYELMENLKGVVQKSVNTMPDYSQFLTANRAG